VLVYVSGRDVVSVPEGLGDDARRRELQQWSRDNDVRWYVHQNPLMPGRIWHFRVSPWLHEQITGYAPAPDRASFELYRMNWYPMPEMPDRRWLEHVRRRPVFPPLLARDGTHSGRCPSLQAPDGRQARFRVSVPI